jgi:predicted nucleic acid-binding protein
MSDIFDKLSLLFDDRDEEENKKHAEHMRDALAYQVFLGVQFFAELAYRLAPSREIAHSTLEMATLEGERDCYAKSISDTTTAEDRDEIMRHVEFLDSVIIKKQNDFLENTEEFVNTKKDDSREENKDVH